MGTNDGLSSLGCSRVSLVVSLRFDRFADILNPILSAMQVFKVETIGDCNMAVTGFPYPVDVLLHHLARVISAGRRSRGPSR